MVAFSLADIPVAAWLGFGATVAFHSRDVRWFVHGSTAAASVLRAPV